MVVAPWDSSATMTSSWVIADAIQSACRWETRPESAVTRPPPPRWTIRFPFSSCPNSAGPRLETMVSGYFSATPPLYQAGPELLPTSASWSLERQIREDPDPVEQQARAQEPLTRALLAGPSQPATEFRVEQDVDAAPGSLLRRGDQVAVLAVDDLQRDPADIPPDRRAPLPERLGHCQPEALPDRLLHDHVGLGLERVHLDRSDVVEVVEDLDVRIRPGVLEGPVEELPALRVIGGHRADQRQLHLRDLLRHQPVRVDHPDRVLPGVEAGDLGDHRAVHVDSELVADEGRVVG